MLVSGATITGHAGSPLLFYDVLVLFATDAQQVYKPVSSLESKRAVGGPLKEKPNQVLLRQGAVVGS